MTAGLPSQADAPYFRRRFSDGETRELRIYLKGGDDQVVFRGGADANTVVRVIGGSGDDRFEFESSTRRVRLYDSEGENSVSGSDPPSLNAKNFEEWIWSEEDRDQPRDWGRRTLPLFWTTYSSDLGLFLGGGVRLEGYGFRKRPYASAFDVRGGFAPALRKGRVQVDGRLNRENSAVFWKMGTRVSRLDVIHYYGLGNDRALSGPQSFHKVDQTAAALELGLGVPRACASSCRAASFWNASARPRTPDAFTAHWARSTGMSSSSSSGRRAASFLTRWWIQKRRAPGFACRSAERSSRVSSTSSGHLARWSAKYPRCWRHLPTRGSRLRYGRAVSGSGAGSPGMKPLSWAARRRSADGMSSASPGMRLHSETRSCDYAYGARASWCPRASACWGSLMRDAYTWTGRRPEDGMAAWAVVSGSSPSCSPTSFGRESASATKAPNSSPVWGCRTEGLRAAEGCASWHSFGSGPAASVGVGRCRKCWDLCVSCVGQRRWATT